MLSSLQLALRYSCRRYARPILRTATTTTTKTTASTTDKTTKNAKGRPHSQSVSLAAAAAAKETAATDSTLPSSLSSTTNLDTNQTIKEGPSWVTILPPHVSRTPRHRSRELREAGNFREAHALLRSAGVHHTHNQQDLIEFLLVLQHTDEFTGPHERLNAMLEAIWATPIRKSKRAFRIVLNACLYEAANVSDNAIVKLAAVERTADTIWKEMRHFRRSVDPSTIAIMYRICGLCRAYDLAKQIRGQVDIPAIRTTVTNSESAKSSPSSTNHISSPALEEATAEYILCLGKCGRPVDAERVFFSHESRAFRSSPRVLAALFQAYLAASRISKAEALISMHGASFLDLGSCNAFIRQCASLRLFDTAMAFLDRMERFADTGFPKPVSRTYNILLHGVSKTRIGADDNFEHTANEIVSRMKKHGIEPTTVTYNTLIRSFILRGKMSDAMTLFKSMGTPDRITFSHLMQGAANVNDADVAITLLHALEKRHVRPTYGFCKSFLHAIAHEHGVEAAYERAHQLVDAFSDVLVFGDVGPEEAIRMSLIHACGKVGDLPAAFRALGMRIGTVRTDGGPLAPLYVATVLMQACLDCGSEGQALEVFDSLKTAGQKPNFEVYESLIKGLCHYVKDNASGMTQYGTRRNINKAEQYEDDYNDEDTSEDDAKRPFENDDGDYYDGNIEAKSSTSFSKQRNKDVDYDESASIEATNEEAMEVFNETLRLVREMHESGAARTTRKATFMYNLLIVASAAIGKFELGMEIFRRMTRHSNTKVLYYASASPLSLQSDNEWNPTSASQTTLLSDDEKDWPELKGCVELPPATVMTYNSMMSVAWRCARAHDALTIFDRLQMDRETEPNDATLGLLADIGLECADPSIVQNILLELDRVRLPPRIARKRVLLRQKTLAMRWPK